jgi:hypothetical protein
MRISAAIQREDERDRDHAARLQQQTVSRPRGR